MGWGQWGTGRDDTLDKLFGTIACYLWVNLDLKVLQSLSLFPGRKSNSGVPIHFSHSGKVTGRASWQRSLWQLFNS